LRILAGGESLAPASESETRIATRNRLDTDLRLACRVTVCCDLTVTAPYW
jgi:ferredoxin